MSTKTMKILTFVATLLLVVSIGATTVFGAATAIDPSTINGSGSDLTDTDVNAIKNLGHRIINVLQIVGSVLAVVILAVLGIKYMMGSAEEKADYKKSMMPYVVGAICIFLAPTLASAVYNLVS